MQQRFYKPLQGRLVRDPITAAPLPVDGDWRAATTFYLRRLLDGDIEDATPPAAAPARAGKTATKE